MSANIYQQTKEISVLRSTGVSKCKVVMMYFYEASILVLASCLHGVMVGMIMGYTMTL